MFVLSMCGLSSDKEERDNFIVDRKTDVLDGSCGQVVPSAVAFIVGCALPQTETDAEALHVVPQ